MQHKGSMALLVFLCLVAGADAVRARQESNTVVNPIRKVVTMLQNMQKKVEEEGEKEEELYKKFMCFCKNGGDELSASISAAENKVPQVSSDLKEAENKLVQTKEALKQAQVDRAAAKDAVKEATGIREKEAKAFAAEKAEYDANIASVNSAVAAIEKGMGSFLQSSLPSKLKVIVSKASIAELDRQELMSFLAEGASYAPQSGSITGILKEMGSNMEKALADATASEEAAIKAFEELSAAKKKEIEALTGSIEAKTGQVGDLGVAIVTMKEDLSDTQEQLAEDKKFLANLESTCKTKSAEWAERSKTRAEELVALADTIKILNDDDALELFKKTLPSPGTSFVQSAASNAVVRKQGLLALKEARSLANEQDRAALDRIVLLVTAQKANGKKGFEKVIKMIDDMVALLKTEQVEDDSKKEYCQKQFDETEDKKKSLQRTESDEETAITAATDGIATLTSEIAALEAGIKELDKSVAEATEQRKEEHAEYKETMASNNAAKEIMGIAKNRLNKFYNPKLYKPPAEEEGKTEAVAMLAQMSLRKEAVPPPPETWGAYTKKSEESNGVVAMINLLIRDLDKDMTEAETEEKNSQEEYEKLMEDSTEKRAVDSKALTEKGAAKADMEAALEQHKQNLKDAQMELMATMKYISNLHSECDWLLQYFDVRKEARAGEVEALGKAKAVLSGADFSLLQLRMH